MLGVEVTNEAIGAIQAVAIAAVGGWVAIRTRQIDQRMRRADRRFRKEKERCDALEKRVQELEEKLTKFRTGAPKR